jgi:hypothetical protein
MVTESTSGYILNLEIYAGEGKKWKETIFTIWNLILIKITTRVFGKYFLKISVHKNSLQICYKFLKKHSIKVELHCLNPGKVHLNNLNAPVLSV